MTAITADSFVTVPSLRFASSASRKVGLSGSLMDMVRANAPRIVGAMKLAGFAMLAGNGDPLMIAAACFGVIGKLIMIGFGSKENQKEAAQNATPEVAGLASDTSIAGNIKKAMHPKAYPVESSSGFSVISDVFSFAYGVSQFFVEKPAITPFVYGAIALASDTNMLLGKEKKEAGQLAGKENSLKFSQSQSKAEGWLGDLGKTLKENPVLTSSLINICFCAVMIVGALVEGGRTTFATAMGIFLAGDLLQAFFVKKKDFSVEGAGNAAGSFAMKEQLRTPQQITRT